MAGREGRETETDKKELTASFLLHPEVYSTSIVFAGAAHLFCSLNLMKGDKLL